MTYIVGKRDQKTLFPPTIEDYVGTEDPVRAYDAFVENMDFQEMGLPIIPFKAGAHEYHPKSMVKLLIYGYSYGIRSSRKLVLMKMGIRKSVSSQSIFYVVSIRYTAGLQNDSQIS